MPVIDSDVAARCVGLVKCYPKVTAVDGLDLEVQRGECFGLLGPNGAGKTTTVEILEGLTPPDEGTVELFGQGWGQGHDHAIRQRLGIQLQEVELQPNMTVEEVVRLFRSFYRRGRGIDEVIDLVQLGEKRRARVEKLSGGQKQRLALATAFIGDPDLLFLDEPTTGLDPQARLRVWSLIEAFLAAGGTVLLTTHYMEEASRLCHRVGIIDRGKVIALGSPRELIASMAADQIVELRAAGQLEIAALDQLSGVASHSERDGVQVLTVSDIGSALPALLDELARQGVGIGELNTHEPTLEDVFVGLTGRALRDE